MADRRAILAPQFLEDLEFWLRSDRKVALRQLKIVRATLRDPYGGLAKPKPLKGALTGLWSRRLTLEHRAVYEVAEEEVRFLQARYHY